MESQSKTLSENLLIELEITDLAFDGKSVAHLDGKVVFLDSGLPGEKVLAEVFKSKPRYSLAKVREIIRKSDFRVAAPCVHFGYCGGCTWQDLSYNQQLAFKHKQVRETLNRIGGLAQVEVSPIVGAEDIFAYRNKMEFSFDADPANPVEFTLGLHVQGRFDKIFDLEYCHLTSKRSNEMVAWVRGFAKQNAIPAYNVARHTGFLRFLVIRRGVRTGQYLLNIVTNSGSLPHQDIFVQAVTEAFPDIVTIIHSQNSKKSNIAVGEIETILYGPGYYEERLLDQTFRIRSNSFFQTNTMQAERLFQVGFDIVGLSREDRLLDLYCGAGTIGILAAHSVGEVVGVELVPDAIVAARENAVCNNIDNIRFVHQDVKDFLTSELSEGVSDRFSIIVIDPPRAGMHPKTVKRLIELNPARILYISCNPATFARDAQELTNAGYHLPKVVPVDMFPHTKHIEVVGGFFRG